MPGTTPNDPQWSQPFLEDSPPNIPDHRLIRCIGEGSYGQVWLARNVIGTFRAVKLVFRSNFEDDRPFEREFNGIKKFEPVSRTHEGLVDILQVGRDDQAGYFYYVMEVADDLVSGQEIHPDAYVPKTLSLHLRQRGRLSFEDCVEKGLSITSALSHLHKNGLIHRDIKPSNIIFVNGHAKLADIGLVADLSEARSFVGTEGFIPPEGPGTVQADIFSVGKVLYEIATGKDRKAYPELPETVVASDTGKQFLELTEVINRACASETKDRHQNAEELANELKLLQAGRSVRRLHRLEKQVRFMKRAGVVAAVLAILTSLYYFLIEQNRKKEAELRQRRVGAYVANATRAVDDGFYLNALPLGVEALKLDHGSAERQETHRVRLAAVLDLSPRLVQMLFYSNSVMHAEFTSDGQRMLLASRGQTRLVDAQGIGPESPIYPHPDPQFATLSPDGGKVVVTGNRDTFVFSTTSGERLLVLRHGADALSAKFSPDGTRIVTGCADHSAYVWDAVTGRQLLRLRKHTSTVQYAEFSHDGRSIVTASHDGTALVWDASTGQQTHAPLQHSSWVFHAAFSPDDKRVATASFDRQVLVWETETSRRLLWPLDHPAAVRSVEFSPDGCYLITACWDQTARMWSAHSGRAVQPHLVHNSKLVHAAFAPDGRRIVTTAVDGTVRMWDLARKSRRPPIRQISISADGSCFASVSNSAVHIFDAATDQPVRPPLLAGLELAQCLISSNGQFALTVSTPGADSGPMAQLWDVTSGESKAAPFEISAGLEILTLSLDGRKLLGIRGDTLLVWDTHNGKLQPKSIKHPDKISRLVLSPDGTRVAGVCGNVVLLHDTDSGKPIGQRLSHPKSVSNLAFSPDGDTIVTGCRDSDLTPLAGYLWRATNGMQYGRPLAHQDGVVNVTFSPDGRFVATAGEDDCAILWKAASGELVSVLRHVSEVHAVAFSRDGRWVATASRDGTARVWDALTGDPLTPPLPHVASLDAVKFVGAMSRLVAHQKANARSPESCWEFWDLRREHHSLDDLTMMAQLLSSSGSHYSGGLRPLDQSALRHCWRTLRAKSKSDFYPTEADIRAWHERELRMSESQNRWFGMVFHLKQLLRLDPSNPALQNRLAAAEAGLLKESEAAAKQGQSPGSPRAQELREK